MRNRDGTVLRSLAGRDTDDLVGRLREQFGGRVSFNHSVRQQHSGLEGHHAGLLPDGVVWANSTEDVVVVVRWCSEFGVAVVPHGAGTSVEGQLSAVAGGISLDLSGMRRVVDIRPENFLCTVEAGVTREQLHGELRSFGLFFPVDPGANATLGGMAATRASGTNAVRYGTMRDNVLSLTVVLPSADVIETGTWAAKSAAGYDLTGLFVGSEGTLGVITQATLRLHGVPETIRAATCSFRSLDGAVSAVIAAMQAGLPLARIELLDDRQIAASNAFSGLSLPLQPTLFIEFHGAGSDVAAQIEAFREIAIENGGGAFAFSEASEERSHLWKARHEAYFAAKASRSGCRVWTTDVCVPIDSLAESIVETRRDIDAHKVPATIVGHVGDGNYHVLFLLDPDDPEEERRARDINDRMVRRAIASHGTCTGEHGIGLGKQESLVLEHGEEAVQLMRQIKSVIDPAGLFNPGKVFGRSASYGPLADERPPVQDR